MLQNPRNEADGLFANVEAWDVVKSRWVWEKVRDRWEKVLWEDLLWFPLHIPKMSIISWMVILNRLPTKDRLIRLGLESDGSCGLCEDGLENKENLFNECVFAGGVWSRVMLACRLPCRSMCWNEALAWTIANFKGKSLLVCILKLVWNCFLYFVWEERNLRRFRGCSRLVDEIFE
ncbi:uncharacterized protein LOC120208913 [Hibiscus syriacus]|uniref:uncharacterized protein LOC120208913 n=1 Tax=Hibiscus syriacus TaxID=106335 RepID=UPI0019216668|nr:uncharacterized protein LOC120208913 [Hibiscus syriacus]